MSSSVSHLFPHNAAGLRQHDERHPSTTRFLALACPIGALATTSRTSRAYNIDWSAANTSMTLGPPPRRAHVSMPGDTTPFLVPLCVSLPTAPPSLTRRREHLHHLPVFKLVARWYNCIQPHLACYWLAPTSGAVQVQYVQIRTRTG